MILAIVPFMCLLSLTGAAPANADEQLPTSVSTSHSSLQKREDYCSSYLGRDLRYADCMAAYGDMPENILSDMDNGAISASSVFTDMTTTPLRYRLPQTFRHGNCAIEVTLADGVDMAMTLWDHQRTAAKLAIDWCVSTRGTGGRVLLRATTVTVKINRPTSRGGPDALSQCNKITDQTDLLKCLEDADRAAESARAALDRFTIHLDAIDAIIPPH